MTEYGSMVSSQSDKRYNKQAAFFAYNAEKYDYGEPVGAYPSAQEMIGRKAF